MDIRELRYFAAVFSERNLTAAAKRLFISQPSISTAISNLEAELGAALFIRHKKGVAPTAAAEQFYAISRRIIDEADAAKNLFRTRPARQELKLGLMRTLDIPRTIALLKPLTENPDVTLRLVGASDAADGRIVSKSMTRADEHFLSLWSERYVVALPPSHPLTLKDRLRPADLAGIAMVDRCHCEQSALFDRAPKGETVAIAESEDWAMALVAAGVGIAIVPEGVARANGDVAIREIDAKVKREVGLAYSAKSPSCEALRDFIAKVGKQGRKVSRPTKRRSYVPSQGKSMT
jgi:DNA-binding transcriptional LysR family regulator